MHRHPGMIWGSRVAAVITGTCTVGLFWMSCAVPGFDLVEGTGGQGTGASGGTMATTGGGGQGASGGDGGAGACGSVEPPTAPTASDPGPNDVEFVVAVRSLDFGEGFDEAVGPTVGYDLDKTCTCLGEDEVCQPVGNNPEFCDGPGGRDNAVARFFANLATFMEDEFTSSAQSQGAENGDFSILFRVSDYNGQPNDDSVSVAIYSSPGMDKDLCNASATPNWDGNDVWPVDAITLNGMGMGGMGQGGCGDAGLDVNDPRYVSDQAYVSDGVLVANLPETALALSSGNTVATIDLVAGALTADVVMEAGGWALQNGVLTGRWPVSDIFAILPAIEFMNNPICMDSPAYALVKPLICNFPDIPSGVVGPASPCDALSLGLAFEAEAAQLGIPVIDGGIDPGTICNPGEDPSNDTCSM